MVVKQHIFLYDNIQFDSIAAALSEELRYTTLINCAALVIDKIEDIAPKDTGALSVSYYINVPDDIQIRNYTVMSAIQRFSIKKRDRWEERQGWKKDFINTGGNLSRKMASRRGGLIRQGNYTDTSKFLPGNIPDILDNRSIPDYINVEISSVAPYAYYVNDSPQNVHFQEQALFECEDLIMQEMAAALSFSLASVTKSRKKRKKKSSGSSTEAQQIKDLFGIDIVDM